jgi:hypothetical protein
MSLQGWFHSVARRLGFDVYNHMAGGGLVPFRVWKIPSIGPLAAVTLAAAVGFEIDMEACTSFLGFSYRTGGWNPHVATLEEFLHNPSLRYEDSSLGRLHQMFVPGTLQELFLEDATRQMHPLDDLPPVRRLFRYLWAISPALIGQIGRSDQEAPGHHYFGPVSPEKGQTQFTRLINTFRSIEREGFRPDTHGPVMGYFLADDSSYRFVVGSGNHRLAALKVLGHPTVPVGLTHTHPAVVHRSRLDTWTVDEGGPFERDTAYALFDKLLSEDGLEKARNLGVVGPAVQAPPTHS